MIFKTWYNYDFSETFVFEKVDPVSEAVPGQALTIRELLLNHVRGINLDAISKQPMYDDEPDIDSPDFTRDPMLDLSDVTDRLQIPVPTPSPVPVPEKDVSGPTISETEK